MDKDISARGDCDNGDHDDDNDDDDDGGGDDVDEVDLDDFGAF